MSVHDGNYKAVRKALGIPDDEPIFVIRGQDANAVPTLARYRNLVRVAENGPGQEWYDEFDNHVAEFVTFQTENHGKVKVAD